VCNEGARSKKLDRNALKNLTGGGSVTGRRLGHQAFSFPMTAKIMVVSNDEPVLDLDDPMKQRVHVVPFKVVFRGDPTRDDKNLKQFLKDNELPGIARWMVDGCLEWQKIGLKPPDSVVSRTQEYFVNADLFDQFLLEACEFGSELFTPTLALFVAAKNFCEARGERSTVTSQRIFVADLEKRRPQLKAARPRGEGFSGQSGFFGIRLKQGLVVDAPF
jgi:P4 family phage/plasmid primase-like protien